MRRLLALIVPFLFMAIAATDANAARKVALVIGNDDYWNIEVLQKAKADAESYAALLRRQGFDDVLLGTNQTRGEMDEMIANFLEKIQPGDTAVFAYSGHGWSDGTQNYILGIDAPAAGTQERLNRVSIPLRNGQNGILDDLDRRGAMVKVAIIDACRNNPFQQQGNTTRAFGLERGLALVNPPEGTFLVFSAAPGQTALDRISDADTNPNSVFSRVFIPLLDRGLTLQEAIKETQAQVVDLAREANHNQRPAYVDEMIGATCLFGNCNPNGATPTNIGVQVAALAPAGGIDTAEAAVWEATRSAINAGPFQSYLRQFPNGPHASEAAERIEIIEALGARAPAPIVTPVAVAPVAIEAPVVTPVTPDPVVQAPVQQAMLTPPAIQTPPPAPVIDVTKLTFDLQAQLKRLGCYTSTVDGVWGRGSRASATRFAQLAGVAPLPADPVQDPAAATAFLDIALNRPADFCPPLPAANNNVASRGQNFQQPAQQPQVQRGQPQRVQQQPVQQQQQQQQPARNPGQTLQDINNFIGILNGVNNLVNR